jgi:hypothetical protein
MQGAVTISRGARSRARARTSKGNLLAMGHTAGIAVSQLREAEKARRHILATTPEPEKKRVKALSLMAPPDAAEAADLVARFLAERGATVCPARAVAAVNNGDGVG